MASFPPAAAFFSSRFASLLGFGSRGSVVRVAGGGGGSGGIVVLVARGGSRALCGWHRCLFCPRCVVAFSAPAAWLRFAAASAFRRPHISSWFSRFCLGLFIGCSALRGFSLRPVSRSHAGCLSFVGRLFQQYSPRLRLGCLSHSLRLGYLYSFVK